MAEFLDPKILRTLNEAFNSTNLFFQDSEQKQHFNLVCAVMDRISTCLEVLNENSEIPESEKDFIVFMVFGCILKDAVDNLIEELEIKENKNLKTTLFKEFCAEYNLTHKNKMLTDDEFISYLRVLIFAHSTKTTDRKPNKPIVSCPFLITKRNATKRGHVGVMIYPKGKPGMQAIEIPFVLLKKYISQYYARINLATNKIKEIIGKYEQKWRQRKVNRDGSSSDILRNIISILEERFVEHYEFDDALCFLQTEISVQDKKNSVAKFKNAIAKKLPRICRCIDNLNHNEAISLLDEVCNARPSKIHSACMYQLEKIFCYLDKGIRSDNVIWGLRQAKEFSKQFARKWVTIDTDNMSFEEIKLLVATACYCEREDQKRKELQNEPV